MMTTYTDRDAIDAMVDRLMMATPESLKELPAWLLWKAEPRPDGTVSKVPWYANGAKRSGTQGTREDRSQLATFTTAMEAFQGGGFTGLGIATLPDFGIVIGDFDAKAGKGLHPEALTLANTTYAERSPGGAGIHAIWTGAMPSGKNNPVGVEVFGSTGFVTFTAQRLNDLDTEPMPDAVKRRLGEILGARPDASTTTTGDDVSGPEHADAPTLLALKSALRSLDADNYETWTDCGQRLKRLGGAGRSLWMDWSATCPTFDEREAAEKWRTFTAEKTGYAAIFREAQKLGWINPASRVATNFEALEGYATDTQKDRPFFVSAGDIMKNKSPPDWLIQNHFERQTFSLLVGHPMAGKSFLALDWALSIATGREWNGLKVRQGTVAFLAGEGHGGFRKRCAAWAQHNDVNIDTAPLFFNQQTAQLIEEESCLEIQAAAQSIIEANGSLALIVVDTWNRVGGGEENSSNDTAKILTNAERYLVRPFGCAVLVVHHPGHGPIDRSRGSSSLPAGVDSAFGLKVEGDVRVLTNTKQKDSELLDEQHFTLATLALDEWPDDPDTGKAVTSCVLTAAQAPDKAQTTRPLTARLQAALDALGDAMDSTGKPTPENVKDHFGFTAPLRVVFENEWRAGFYKSTAVDSGDSEDTKGKAFRRAKSDLVKRQLVKGHDGWFWKSSDPIAMNEGDRTTDKTGQNRTNVRPDTD